MLWRVIRKVCVKEKLLVCKKGGFSAHAKPTNKEKPFFSTAKLQFPTAPKLTCSYKFHPRKPCCELAVQQPFFETSQSCVSTKATLSHRFKSSPSIPGKVALSGAAGYMMTAGHFRENHVSSGDLNRPPESRGSQTSGVLLVLFVQAKRIKSFPFGKFEVFQTSNQPTQTTTSH